MKHAILFSFLLFSTHFNFFAQQNAVELEKRLKKSQGQERFEILYDLTKIYIRISPKKSISYGKKAIDIAKKQNDKNLQADVNNLVGTAYYNLDDYRGALKYYEEELALRKSLGQESSRIKILLNIGSIYQAWDKPSKAIDYYEEALIAAKKIKSSVIVFNCYDNLIRLYAGEKKFKEAYEKLYAYMELKSISLPSTEQKKLAILETKYQEEKNVKEETIAELKEKDSTLSVVKVEKEFLENDTSIKSKAINNLTVETNEQKLTIEEQKEQNRRQRQWLLAFTLFIAVVIAFSIILYKQFRAKKKALEMLKIQHAEIVEQKEEIQNLADKLIKSNNDIFEQKEEIEAQAEQLSIVNKEISMQRDEILFQKAQITDSIVYASRIQSAMLPKKDFLSKIFNEYMILWRPQEIVSGDFYWVKQVENNIVFAAADCTGHGVPGAFMSMLGISFLDEIVTESNQNKSNEILNALRKRIKNALNQTGKANEAADGMDIALCVLNTESNILQYSGAYNPLYLIRDNQLQVIKPDMQPIAIYPRETEFTLNELELKKDDVIYIFSDGFLDQFGGEFGDKLKAARFKNLLLEIHQKPLRMQEALLNDFILNWIGNKYLQIDDMLIFGIRI